MAVAIVYFAKKHRKQYQLLCRAIGQGLASRGGIFDIVDGESESDKRMSLYQYIIIGCEPASLFGGKIPSSVSRFLSRAGSLGGKRSCCFVGKHIFASTRALNQLMKAMEREGMYLTYSQVCSTEDDAKSMGNRLLL